MNPSSPIFVRFHVSLAALAALVSLIAVLSSTPLVAQTTRLQTTASTGLHLLANRHTMHVFLVQVGEAVEPTEVELRVLDAQDRELRNVRGVLVAGEPVRLSLEGPSQGARAVRVEAVLVTSRTNLGTAPVLNVEVVNQLTLDSSTASSCPIPYDPKGSGGEVLGNCGGGCQINDLVVP